MGQNQAGWGGSGRRRLQEKVTWDGVFCAHRLRHYVLLGGSTPIACIACLTSI